MKLSKSHVVMFSLALILLIAGNVFGIDLKGEPIQTGLNMQIASDGWQETANSESEFGDEPVNENPNRKSPLKAGVLAALLPGAGQLYTGHTTKAKVFFGAEAALWIGFASYKTYADWREDDFINFAAERANANLEGKDEEFQDWVGFYDDIDQYNTAGRIIEPSRPYLVDDAENHWQWQDPADKATYRHIKNRSREADKRADLMLGLLVANRVIAVVDAVRDAIRDNRRLPGEFSSKKIHPEFAINPFDPVRPVYLGIVAPL